MNRVMKTYFGTRTHMGPVVLIHYRNRRFDGKLGKFSVLSPITSLAVHRHSPTGFEWGYEGSGPAQLALAILLDVGMDVRRAQSLYQDFKRDVVSHFKRDSFTIKDVEVREWIRKHEDVQMTIWDLATQSKHARR
jgi:hypothetical protein